MRTLSRRGPEFGAEVRSGIRSGWTSLVEPSPFRAFAFPSTTVAIRPVDDEPPVLPRSYLTGQMPIVGFASPGVVLGSVALVHDVLIYSTCPTVPPAGLEWKNHGHYVRCVAWKAEALFLAGTITSEEADAIVKAAAESETGK
jgi:hypothetical protein